MPFSFSFLFSISPPPLSSLPFSFPQMTQKFQLNKTRLVKINSARVPKKLSQTLYPSPSFRRTLYPFSSHSSVSASTPPTCKVSLSLSLSLSLKANTNIIFQSPSVNLKNFVPYFVGAIFFSFVVKIFYCLDLV